MNGSCSWMSYAAQGVKEFDDNDDDVNDDYDFFFRRPHTANSKQTKLHMYIFFPMPPHSFCGIRGLPSRAWQECDRHLSLGPP